MREIYYRGKRKDNGEWVHGGILHYGNGAGEHSYIIVGGMFPKFVEVIPETTGQYTGLMDKDSIMIFEDDIIMAFWASSKQPKIFLIKWGEVWKGWCGKDKHGESIFHTEEKKLSEMKIIGNIHDNPELLGRKQEEKTI
jgi:uncharacterized phage protein (TIGR01671 family)